MASQHIPTVSQEPVKSLGRWYDSSMKDTKKGQETVELATEGLLAINRCGLQGKHPETPGMPPFWAEVFMYPFSARYFVKRDAMTEKNIFPSTFNSEIGRN